MAVWQAKQGLCIYIMLTYGATTLIKSAKFLPYQTLNLTVALKSDVEPVVILSGSQL